MGHEQGRGYDYGHPDARYAAEEAASTLGWDYVRGHMAGVQNPVEQAQQLQYEAAALRDRYEMEARAAARGGGIVYEQPEPEFEYIDNEPDSGAEPDPTRSVPGIKSDLGMLSHLGLGLEEDPQPVHMRWARKRLARQGIIVSDQDDASALLSGIIEAQQQELYALLAGVEDDSPLMHHLPGVGFQSPSYQGVRYDIESVEHTNGGATSGLVHLSRRSSADGEISRASLHRSELVDALLQGTIDETIEGRIK